MVTKQEPVEKVVVEIPSEEPKEEEKIEEPRRPKKKKTVDKAPFKKIMQTIRPSEMNSLLELINPGSTIKIDVKPKAFEWLIQFIRECYNALEHVLLSPTSMVQNDFFEDHHVLQYSL